MIPEMEQSIQRGSVAMSIEPVWLAAFAFYNFHNKLRLRIDFDSSYPIVLNFLKAKLK